MKKRASPMVYETEGPFLKRKSLFFYGTAAFFLIACLLGIAGVFKLLNDPEIPLLISERGADWIRARQPTELKARPSQILTTFFRARFEIDTVPRQAIFTLRAMKRIIVWLDDQIIFMSDPRIHEWKQMIQVDVKERLNPGKHEIRIAVTNHNSYPVMIAYCEELGVATGEHWEAAIDGKNWKPALSVKSWQYPVDCNQQLNINPALMNEPVPLPKKFQRADKAFLSKLPVFLPIFIAVFIFSVLSSREKRPTWLKSPLITAGGVRWVVLVAWICLAINNIGKIPLYAGMDSDDHLKYIVYVATTWRIPLATEGWQMFQPPLFYIISAILCRLLADFFSLETVFMILRVIPLICGAIQIELCWRALRYVFPGKEDLQIAGTLVGGLLPMNIYISQVVGNEPLAGCLSAVAVVLIIRYLSLPAQHSNLNCTLMGLSLGLAMLTKVTAVLLVPPVLLAITYKGLAEHDSLKKGLVVASMRIGVILGVAFLVSGWYYIRNYLEMGRFFIGGWDASRNIEWWQDPSYRNLEQFYIFGESLFYPVYSAVTGIWDSLYSTFWMDGFLSGVCIYDFRPPWNYGFMFASIWLALLPSAAIALGVLASIVNPFREDKRAAFFCTLCAGIYLSAILYLFLAVPIYSTGKATYALGLIPCFAVLCAEGFNILTSKPFLKALIYGIVACWVFASYAAYFII